MKNQFCLLIIVIGTLLLNCSSSDKIESQKKVDVFLKGEELYVGDYLVDMKSSISDIENVIGKPSRTKKYSEEEIVEHENEFGRKPSTKYIYDDYGIIIYQDINSSSLESISFEFIENRFDHYPKQMFTGNIHLDKTLINKDISYENLSKILDYDIKKSKLVSKSTFYNQRKLTFEFDLNDYRMVGLSIKLNDTPKNVNEKGWSEEDIKQMKILMKNQPKIIEFSKTYNFNIEDVAQCYADKVSTIFLYSDIHELPIKKEIQEKNKQIIEECIGDNIKE